MVYKKLHVQQRNIIDSHALFKTACSVFKSMLDITGITEVSRISGYKYPKADFEKRLNFIFSILFTIKITLTTIIKGSPLSGDLTGGPGQLPSFNHRLFNLFINPTLTITIQKIMIDDVFRSINVTANCTISLLYYQCMSLYFEWKEYCQKFFAFVEVYQCQVRQRLVYFSNNNFAISL